MATSLLLSLLPSFASFFHIYHHDSQGSFCRLLFWALCDKDNLTRCSTLCKSSFSSISTPKKISVYEMNVFSTLAL